MRNESPTEDDRSDSRAGSSKLTPRRRRGSRSLGIGVPVVVNVLRVLEGMSVNQLLPQDDHNEKQEQSIAPPRLVRIAPAVDSSSNPKEGADALSPRRVVSRIASPTQDGTDQGVGFDSVLVTVQMTSDEPSPSPYHSPLFSWLLHETTLDERLKLRAAERHEVSNTLATTTYSPSKTSLAEALCLSCGVSEAVLIHDVAVYDAVGEVQETAVDALPTADHFPVLCVQCDLFSSGDEQADSSDKAQKVRLLEELLRISFRLLQGSKERLQVWLDLEKVRLLPSNEFYEVWCTAVARFLSSPSGNATEWRLIETECPGSSSTADSDQRPPTLFRCVPVVAVEEKVVDNAITPPPFPPPSPPLSPASSSPSSPLLPTATTTATMEDAVSATSTTTLSLTTSKSDLGLAEPLTDSAVHAVSRRLAGSPSAAVADLYDLASALCPRDEDESLYVWDRLSRYLDQSAASQPLRRAKKQTKKTTKSGATAHRTEPKPPHPPRVGRRRGGVKSEPSPAQTGPGCASARSFEELDGDALLWVHFSQQGPSTAVLDARTPSSGENSPHKEPAESGQGTQDDAPLDEGVDEGESEDEDVPLWRQLVDLVKEEKDEEEKPAKKARTKSKEAVGKKKGSAKAVTAAAPATAANAKSTAKPLSPQPPSQSIAAVPSPSRTSTATRPPPLPHDMGCLVVETNPTNSLCDTPSDPLRALLVQWSAVRQARLRPSSSTTAAGNLPPERRLILLLVPAASQVESALLPWTLRPFAENTLLLPLFAVGPLASKQAPVPQKQADTAAALPSSSSSVVSSPSTRRRQRKAPGSRHGVDKGTASAEQSTTSKDDCVSPLQCALAKAFSLFHINPAHCFGVARTTDGVSAMAPLLPSDRVFDSPEQCSAALLTWDTVLSSVPVQPFQGPVAAQRDYLFDRLCTWNGLAQTLRRSPRRPEVVLRHVPCSANEQSSTTSVLYGLARLSSSQDGVFAPAASREVRLRSTLPPTLPISPSEQHRLFAFLSSFFSPPTFHTAVNLVHTVNKEEYFAGYTCRTDSFLQYDVSSWVRRFVRVSVRVSLAPFLLLHGHKEASMSSSATSASGLLPYQAVLPQFTCSCTPLPFEPVAQTETGEKKCRHMAELLYYFVERHLVVRQREEEESTAPPRVLSSQSTAANATPPSTREEAPAPVVEKRKEADKGRKRPSKKQRKEALEASANESKEAVGGRVNFSGDHSDHREVAKTEPEEEDDALHLLQSRHAGRKTSRRDEEIEPHEVPSARAVSAVLYEASMEEMNEETEKAHERHHHRHHHKKHREHKKHKKDKKAKNHKKHRRKREKLEEVDAGFNPEAPRDQADSAEGACTAAERTAGVENECNNNGAVDLAGNRVNVSVWSLTEAEEEDEEDWSSVFTPPRKHR